MKVTLNWINRNTLDDGVQIYRELSVIESIDGLTPIATLPPGATTYEDTTVAPNTLYHYRVRVFNTYDSYLGKNIPVSTYAYNGPGPQEFLWGDYELGYFGEIPVLDFLTPEEVRVLCNVTVGATNTSSIAWLKFARKGKVLLIPKSPVSLTMTWISLYNLGLVFGDTPEIDQDLTGVTTTVPQNKIIEAKGDYFRVRLPKGLPDGQKKAINYAANGYPSNAEYLGAEIDELLLPLMGVFGVSTSGPVYYNNTPSLYSNNYGTLCQEAASTDRRLMRVSNTYPAGSGFPAPAGTTIAFGGITTAVNCGWRPVFEYLPELPV